VNIPYCWSWMSLLSFPSLSHTHSQITHTHKHRSWKPFPPLMVSSRSSLLTSPPLSVTHTHQQTHTHTHTPHTHIYDISIESPSSPLSSHDTKTHTHTQTQVVEALSAIDGVKPELLADFSSTLLKAIGGFIGKGETITLAWTSCELLCVCVRVCVCECVCVCIYLSCLPAA